MVFGVKSCMVCMACCREPEIKTFYLKVKTTGTLKKPDETGESSTLGHVPRQYQADAEWERSTEERSSSGQVTRGDASSDSSITHQQVLVSCKWLKEDMTVFVRQQHFPRDVPDVLPRSSGV